MLHECATAKYSRFVFGLMPRNLITGYKDERNGNVQDRKWTVLVVAGV